MRERIGGERGGKVGAGLRRGARRPAPVAALMAAFMAALLLAACGARNPATGRWQPIVVAPAEEADLGEVAHRQFLERFDLFEAPALAAYVAEVGARLAAASERPELAWRFFLLDDPSVNAFATPGGYVYVTRGLLAFADSEADLAAVLAHEIAHVTAAHYLDVLALQRRLERPRAAPTRRGDGGPLDAADEEAVEQDRTRLTPDEAFAALAQANELEADRLSLRYLARAGYPPKTAMDFLRDVAALLALERRSADRDGAAAPVEITTTHPLSEARIEALAAALEAAEPIAAEAPAPDLTRAAYLGRVDGLAFGAPSGIGVLRDGVYALAELDFALTLPPEFRATPLRGGLFAESADGANLFLDADPERAFGDLATALDDLRLRVAAANAGVGVFAADPRPIAAAGRPALRLDLPEPTADATALRRSTLVVIDWPTAILRLVLSTKAATAAAQGDRLAALLEGAGPLGPDAERFGPLAIAIRPAAPGETIADLAAGAPLGPFAAARLRLLNGLEPGEEPAAGQPLKEIVFARP